MALLKREKSMCILLDAFGNLLLHLLSICSVQFSILFDHWVECLRWEIINPNHKSVIMTDVLYIVNKVAVTWINNPYSVNSNMLASSKYYEDTSYEGENVIK